MEWYIWLLFILWIVWATLKLFSIGWNQKVINDNIKIIIEYASGTNALVESHVAPKLDDNTGTPP